MNGNHGGTETRRLHKVKNYRSILKYTALILLICLSCSYKPPKDPNAKPGKGLNFFPIWFDNMLGQEYGESYQEELPMLDNTRAQRTVEAIGMDMVHAYYGPEVPPYHFNFHVINLDVVNAFCLPGGSIFVFRGLLDEMETPEELAGVLAHEMGHAVARHGTKDMSKEILYSSALMAGAGLLSEKHEHLAAAVYIAGSVGLTVGMLKHSRDHEREADWIGVHTVYKARYNPAGMLQLFNFFSTLQDSKAPGALMFLSTHPGPKERAKNVDLEIKNLDLVQQWKGDDHGFAAMKAELKRIPDPPKKWKGWDGRSLTSADSLASAVVNGRAQELEEEQRSRESQTVKVYVPSNEKWIDTGLKLEAGRRVDLTASGAIQWGSKPQDTCGPDGASSTAFMATKTDAPKGALLARVGESTEESDFQLIGSSGTIRVANSNRLYLGVNDDNNTDNSGWYVVSVRIHE